MQLVFALASTAAFVISRHGWGLAFVVVPNAKIVGDPVPITVLTAQHWLTLSAVSARPTALIMFMRGNMSRN